MKQPEIRPLTSLRFVVAYWVVAYHYLRPALERDAWVPDWATALVAAGFVGVPVFFVLSGYVLAYNYAPATVASSQGARRFWWSRFARIYPLYAAAFVLSIPPAIYALWTRHPGVPSPAAHLEGLLLSPLLLQAWAGDASNAWNPPGWTISVEAFFYLLFPLFAARASGPRLHALLAASTALAAIVLAVALAQGGPAWTAVAARNPLVHLPAFVAGMALARRHAAFASLGGRRADALVLAAAGGLGAVILVLALGGASPRIANPLLNSLLPIPFVALAIAGLAGSRGRIASAMSGQRLGALGCASYGVYILQAPLAKYVLYLPGAVGVPLAGSYVGFALFSAVLVGAALAAHRWLEVPAQRALRRRLSPVRPRSAAATPAPS